MNATQEQTLAATDIDDATSTVTEADDELLGVPPGGEDSAPASPDSAEHHDHGLSDVGYIKVALLLAVLTAAEVLTYFVDTGPIEVPALLILMVVKFWIVVAYFMHLRFDSKIFTWLFGAGILLTIAVYAALGTSMVFWTDPAGCNISASGC